MKERVYLKSSVKLESSINIFYFIALILGYVNFIYISGVYEIKEGILFLIKFSIVANIVINLIISEIWIKLLANELYYLPEEVKIEDLYIKVKEFLEERNFKTSLDTYYYCIIARKNDRTYYITLKNGTKLRVAEKCEKYRIGIIRYRDCLKDIPVIVSVIQDCYIKDFEPLYKIKTKISFMGDLKKIVLSIGLFPIMVIFVFMYAVLVGVYSLDYETKAYYKEIEEKQQKYSNLKKTLYIETEEDYSNKSYEDILQLDYQPYEVEIFMDYDLKVSNEVVLELINCSCYFQKQIILDENTLLHICFWDDYKKDKLNKYIFEYDIEESKFVKVTKNGEEVYTSKGIERAWMDILEEYYKKSYVYIINDFVMSDCIFLQTEMKKITENNYVYECIDKLKDDYIFEVYEVTPNGKGWYYKETIGIYKCDIDEGKIYKIE